MLQVPRRKNQSGSCYKNYLGVAIVDRMAWEDLAEEVTFEQKLEEGKGAFHEDILGKNRSGTRES